MLANAIFRQAVPKSGDVHEDPFDALLKASLKQIGAGRDVRCEDQSLDVLSDKSTSSTRGDDKISILSHENIDWLQPLHDIVFGPIEDLLDGDELVVLLRPKYSAPFVLIGDDVTIEFDVNR